MPSILKNSFKESVARSHPWTPKKMGTLEQSNLGSKPYQPVGGAADRGPRPPVLEEARATSLCTAHGPHSRWPGTSLRDQWARWLGILEGLQGMGQDTSLEKYLQKLWKNTPPFMHEMHMGEKNEFLDEYSWVFVQNLKIFSICTNIILAYYPCEILKVMLHSDSRGSLAKFQNRLQCHCLCELASLPRKANLILFNLPFSGV